MVDSPKTLRSASATRRSFSEPWWPRPDVVSFDFLVHVLTGTSRHAGCADVLRE
ncbi:hypothetical protein ACFV4N_03060 [Actinosynnema sp. NPDC059797]